MTCWLPKQNQNIQNMDELVSYTLIIGHTKVNNILFSKLFQWFHYFCLVYKMWSFSDTDSEWFYITSKKLVFHTCWMTVLPIIIFELIYLLSFKLKHVWLCFKTELFIFTYHLFILVAFLCCGVASYSTFTVTFTCIYKPG